MTSETCSCPVAGFCERRQRRISNLHWSKCQAGKVEMLDRIYTETALHEEYQRQNPPKKVSNKMRARSERGPITRPKGIGDMLHRVFQERHGAKRSCQDCRRAIIRLNDMTADEVLVDQDNIVKDIVSRLSSEAPHLWQRIAVRIDTALHLGQTEIRVRSDLIEAVRRFLAGEA